MRPLAEYKTLVFDCDGVVLNSNQLKIQAYYDVAIKFGANKQQAQALVAHHVKLKSKFWRESLLRVVLRNLLCLSVIVDMITKPPQTRA